METNDKYKDLHSKTIFDFTDDKELLARVFYSWKKDLSTVTDKMLEKDKELLLSNPVANRESYIDYAILIGDENLKAEAEKQFYDDYRAIFNE